MSNYRDSSVQSSKKAYSPPPSLMEYKVSLPPKNQLPLRKRLVLNKAITPRKKWDLQRQSISLQAEEIQKESSAAVINSECPSTPGSHSSGYSSDCTLPLVRSPSAEKRSIKMLKKSYNWVSTRGKTTVFVNKNSLYNYSISSNNPLPCNGLIKYVSFTCNGLRFIINIANLGA